MSITVLLPLQKLCFPAEYGRLIGGGASGDYSVINETVGFTPEILEELEQNENVEVPPPLCSFHTLTER